MTDPLASPPAPYSGVWLRETVEAYVEACESDGSLPPIVQLGHPVLRMQATDYDGQLGDDLLERLLNLMRKTMHAAPGVGLAAPQIGLPLRIAVLEDRFAVDPGAAAAREREPLDYLAILNPRYAARGGRTASWYEGCLSFDGFQAVVERPADIDAWFTAPDGSPVQTTLHGWQARIFQHETDHLGGTVYIDKAPTRSLTTTQEYARRWSSLDIAAARAVLGF